MATPRVIVLTILLATCAILPAQADDRSDIRSVIQNQLQAFKAGDADAAYDLAAPNIQGLFPTPGSFMRMVETGYPPVFRSKTATFGDAAAEGAGLRQEVHLSDVDGKSWIASYTLSKQADGSWKITGCSLREGSDIGV